MKCEFGKAKAAVTALGLVLTMATVCQATSDEPLLQQSDLQYLGAFRVPRGTYGATTGSSLSYGGQAMTYDPTRNGLIMIGRNNSDKATIEISIPEPKIASAISDLNTASVLQNAVRITNNTWNNLKIDGTAVDNGGYPGGFLVYNNKLIGSAFAYYDASSKGALSHFTAALDWSSGSNFQKFYRVGVSPINPTSVNGGFVGGYMGTIPSSWRNTFGGPVLTGLGGISVITRSSFGPSAWVFDPDNLGIMDPAPAKMILGYPSSHPALGTYGNAPNLFFNRATEVRGVVFPEGSSSILFFGRHGLGSTGQGDSCYGNGTPNPALDLTCVDPTATYDPVSGNCINSTQNCSNTGPGSCPDPYCYDPTDSSHGTHAYPYVYRIWSYDANELAKVAAGATNPATGQPYQGWDIKPYQIWNLSFPFAIDNAHILGAAYDPATQRIFVAEDHGDKVGYDPYPLIQVFKVQLPDATPPTTSLLSPAASSALLGNVQVVAAAADNVGVTKVELYLNGTLRNSTTSSPYSFNWDTTSVSNGAYTLQTKAYDAAGNVGQSAAVAVNVANPVPDTAAPSVTSFAIPVTAANLTVPITSLAATDNVAVTGYLITESATPVPSLAASGWTATPPTSFTFSGEGSRKAYAWAKDAAGNLSNAVGAAVTISLPDTTAPAVSFAPISATVSGSLTITATASDNKAVTKVEFYLNGALKATAVSAPYSFSWNSTTVANGPCTITAKAYDAAGNVGQSSVTVKVLNDTTAPVISFLAPTASYVYGNSVSISASATDNVAVAKMELYIDGALKYSAAGSAINLGWNLAIGQHTITVKAYDAANNVATASKKVTRYF